jgi:hypothetical protein
MTTGKRIALEDVQTQILSNKATAKRMSKAQKATLSMRAQLWPDVTEEELWLRNRNDGYTTIPRAMPLFMELIADASKRLGGKSVPAGKSYLALWCRVFDEAVVKVDSEAALAIEAGYVGERNVTTWREHMRVLQGLGFVDFKTVGATQYVLLLNPYHVVKALKEKGWVQEATYNTIYQRALEIRADDFDRVVKKPDPAPAPASNPRPRPRTSPVTATRK